MPAPELKIVRIAVDTTLQRIDKARGASQVAFSVFEKSAAVGVVPAVDPVVDRQVEERLLACGMIGARSESQSKNKNQISHFNRKVLEKTNQITL
jgi:hypothetical protein